MTESIPPLDIYSSDDENTLRQLINYLEEFQRRRDAILHVKLQITAIYLLNCLFNPFFFNKQNRKLTH